MKDIAIFGAGGFGREIACLINLINKDCPTWNLIGFYDDNLSLKGKMISHFAKCLGGMSELNTHDIQLSIVIAIGESNSIKSVRDRIINPNISFPNLVHPDVIFSDKETFIIGEGNIIQRGCVFSCDVSIGNFNVLNGEVACGHDVVIGSFNTFMPDSRISGKVSIGNENFLGVGSIVLQQIVIEHGVRLGAGSVLMTRPQNESLYLGNPAKKFDY